MTTTCLPVSARELHEVAGIATPFLRWIKARIRSLKTVYYLDYEIEEGDYSGDRRVILDYCLSIELALVIAHCMHDKEKREQATAFIERFYGSWNSLPQSKDKTLDLFRLYPWERVRRTGKTHV